jgi:hypothetical protein
VARTGEEAKPALREVPPSVRDRAARLWGSDITRPERVYGGYAPSATFRLKLADGRGAFFKGSYPLPPGSAVEFPLAHEERVYQSAGDVISPWAPSYFGSFRDSRWHVILLEDVGPSTVPPWTVAKARAAMRSYGEFHRSSIGRALPHWLPPRSMRRGELGRTWEQLGQTKDGVRQLSRLAQGRADEALGWLRRNLAALDAAAQALPRIRPPHALLHLDTRSDNVRVHPSATTALRIFDWPFACAGPPELDVAAFAQSIACEGGPDPETLTRWYVEVQPLRPRALASAASAITGFFALRAWRSDVEVLPRLRSIQRRQLCASLAWTSRLLDLPEPKWLAAVPT